MACPIMLAVENAAAGVLQGSTPHESPPSVAAPAAAPNLAKVAEPAAPPTPVTLDAKPPAPRDANGSTAAGSPADSETSAVGAARCEARVVREGAAGDEEEPVHDWAGFRKREASSAAFYAALIDVSLGNALTARQVDTLRPNSVGVTHT